MRNEIRKLVDCRQIVHFLRHIETNEYICFRKNGREYAACFTEEASAEIFRERFRLLEYVSIDSKRIGDAPFEYFWLDGNLINRGILTSRSRNPV